MKNANVLGCDMGYGFDEEGCQRTGCGRLALRAVRGAAAREAPCARCARLRRGGSAGVVTQCDVSAPSARYAPAPPSVAARTRPPSVAPYAT